MSVYRKKIQNLTSSFVVLGGNEAGTARIGGTGEVEQAKDDVVRQGGDLLMTRSTTAASSSDQTVEDTNAQSQVVALQVLEHHAVAYSQGPAVRRVEDRRLTRFHKLAHQKTIAYG
jgi:hypothetical protein